MSAIQIAFAKYAPEILSRLCAASSHPLCRAFAATGESSRIENANAMNQFTKFAKLFSPTDDCRYSSHYMRPTAVLIVKHSASVVLRNFWNLKTRLFAPYGVANPRDRQSYHCGLLLVWPKNPSFLFVPEIAKHDTRINPNVRFDTVPRLIGS